MKKPIEIIVNGKSLEEILKLHEMWLNDEEGGVRAELRDANLQYANLRNADLQGANLRGANLDSSCFPLWCGGLNFKIDEKQAKQLMYHIINLMQHSKIDTSKIVKKQMYKWLSDSHVVTEHNLNILEEIK